MEKWLISIELAAIIRLYAFNALFKLVTTCDMPYHERVRCFSSSAAQVLLVST